MLGQRRRRWPNIKPALGQRPVCFTPRFQVKSRSYTPESKNPILFNYIMNGIPLQRVDKIRDLSVIIISSLSWNSP